MLDAVLGNTPSGATIVSAGGKILRVSDYAAQLLGLVRSSWEGRSLAVAGYSERVFHTPGRPLPEDELPLNRALRGETVTGVELWRQKPDGEWVPLLHNAAPIRNSRGDLIGAISSFADLRPFKALEQSLRDALAQRQEALAQREALYQELAHRVKNHLQILTALAAKQARNTELSAQELANHIQGQLQTLAAVYRGIDRAGVGERIVARALLEEVSRPYATDTVRVEVTVAPPDLTLAPEQASPLGMLVNEAACNSYKHAFRNHGGRIQVSLHRLEPGRLRLEVADDGKGWGPIEPGHKSHGLELMRMFAQQLQGELELSDRPEGGTLVAVELPETDE